MARRTTRFRKTIDFKQWSSIPGLSTTLSTDQLLGGGILGFTEPATVLRMISGGGLIMFDSTRQLADRFDFGYAIGVVSSDAAALGVTALPDPLGEPEYPWLYWHPFSLRSEEASTEASDFLGAAVYRMPAFDSRSMRKMKPGESLVMLLDCQGAFGAPATVVSLESVRVLLGT